MEPLTSGAMVAVCDCCPALQPASGAVARSTQITVAAQARGFNEFTMLSDPLETAGQTFVHPRHTPILFRRANRGFVRGVQEIASGVDPPGPRAGNQLVGNSSNRGRWRRCRMDHHVAQRVIKTNEQSDGLSRDGKSLINRV